MSPITAICAYFLLDEVIGQKGGHLNETIPKIDKNFQEKVKTQVELFQQWVGFQKIEALDRFIKPIEEKDRQVELDHSLILRTLREALFLNLDPLSQQKLEEIRHRFFAHLTEKEKTRLYTDLQFWKFLASYYPISDIASNVFNSL